MTYKVYIADRRESGKKENTFAWKPTHQVVSPLFHLVLLMFSFLFKGESAVAKKLQAIPQFQLLLSNRHQQIERDGGDQEEDAGDEGGEGQRLR